MAGDRNAVRRVCSLRRVRVSSPHRAAMVLDPAIGALSQVHNYVVENTNLCRQADFYKLTAPLRQIERELQYLRSASTSCTTGETDSTQINGRTY